MATSCCGGSAAASAMIAARKFREGDFSMANEANQIDPSLIRLEFIGTAEGAVMYRGPSGQEYRAGRNQDNRYIDVRPGDVERLLALRDGKQPIFQRVDLSAAQAGNIQAPPPAEISLEQLLAQKAALEAQIAKATSQQETVSKLPVPAQQETVNAPKPGRPAKAE